MITVRTDIQITRRRMLSAGSAGGLAVLSMAGCEALSTDPAGQDDAAGQRSNVKEAPELTGLVEAGDLPPLEERLPETPLVVEPIDRPGLYGGTWNSAMLGAADAPWLARTIGYEVVMRWNVEWTTVIPNIAESIETSEDGREFTIHLRKGMRWSDGELFSADDLVFAYEDVLLNEDLTPVFPSWLVTGEERATVEKVNEETVLVTFARPSGTFLTNLGRVVEGSALISKPRHYLEQFHPKYNPDVAEEASEQGYGDWTELFADRSGWHWDNKAKPCLHGWVFTTAVGEGNQVVAERNPYYWKVDTDGRQLPYLDRVVYDVISDDEVILLKAANGELDFHTRHINTFENKPVLAQGREDGNYDFITLQNSYMNEMVISLNLTHKNPVKREIFQNKDFRIGLSYAINRPELNDAAFRGQGVPWQAAPSADSEFFDEEMATQYIEYDPDRANEHLDEGGYAERDEQGFRLGPDGRRISFTVEVAQPAIVPFWIDAMDLVVDYWEQVGIAAEIRRLDRSLLLERLSANQHDASVWMGDGGYKDEILRPFLYFPHPSNHGYAPLWVEWFSSRGEGSAGEKPPEETVQQMELFWQLMETRDEDDRKELFRQILTIAKEHFYAIGTIRMPEGYGILANNFHNVPEVMPESADYATPAPTNPEQYFIE